MDCSNKTYPPGNADLLNMFREPQFDKEAASRIIADIPDLNVPILDLDGYSSTYLFEAQSSNNVEAVRFLLENGADPNIDIPGTLRGCALDDLHFFVGRNARGSNEKT